MPELPEVETVVRNLAPYLRGQTIDAVDVRTPRTVGFPQLEQFCSSIIGRTIDDVRRRGKFVVMPLTDGSVITVHLRMTGELLFVPRTSPNDGPGPYLRALFTFVGGDELWFNDVRRFGRIELLDANQWARRSNDLGVEPLGADFTDDRLVVIFRSSRRRVKSLLLDQTKVVGIGNIYADEALFRADIHPLSIASAIPRASIARLRSAIVDILSSAIEHRGTTLRNYRSGLGETGDNQSNLQVYGHAAGSPCDRCGSPLERIVVDQRGTILCPNCQALFTTLE